MAEYHFDAAAVRDRMVEEIKKLAAQQGFSKVVIGISGGKDSPVTAALCARAKAEGITPEALEVQDDTGKTDEGQDGRPDDTV